MYVLESVSLQLQCVVHQHENGLDRRAEGVHEEHEEQPHEQTHEPTRTWCLQHAKDELLEPRVRWIAREDIEDVVLVPAAVVR